MHLPEVAKGQKGEEQDQQGQRIAKDLEDSRDFRDQHFALDVALAADHPALVRLGGLGTLGRVLVEIAHHLDRGLCQA